MEIDNIPKELIAKIQKLMKLEEGAKTVGNIEEAANAAAKIRDILMKYNLDLYTVQTAGDQTTKEVPITDMDRQPEEFTKPHEGDWVKRLTKTIAPFYLCKAFGYSGKSSGMKVNIVGTPTNIEILWYTVEQLVNRLRPMSRESFREYKGHEKRNTYFRGFFTGAVDGIHHQLGENARREKWRAEQAELQRRNGVDISDNDTTSIMVINMQLQQQRKVETYIRDNMSFSSSKGSGPRGTSSQSGRAFGYETGKSINISSGIGTSIPKSRRLG